MTTTPTIGAAIQRYKIGYPSDDWGQRSSTPSGIPDASGSWVRYEDHIAALAAGQATAAPAQPAAQQPHRSGCTAGTDEECVQRGCGTNCPAVSPRQGAAYAVLPDEVVRLAQVAIRECQYKGNDMPQDWMESAMRACRLIAASNGQASSQAGEYPALVCDYCGALTPDPWHSSGMLHGKMSKHIHSCDACAARGAAQAQAAKQQEQLI